MVGRCRLLHARRQIHRIAQRSEFSRLISANIAQQRQPCVNSHPNPKLGPVLLGNSFLKGLHSGQNFQSGPHSPLSIVLSHRLSAKEGQNGITHQARHQSLVPVNWVNQKLKGLFHNVGPFFRVHFLRHCRRPLNITEQNGHQLALLLAFSQLTFQRGQFLIEHHNRRIYNCIPQGRAQHFLCRNGIAQVLNLFGY